MAGSAGPDLVQNGLILALDAADKNSYKGSGTSWFDLSGNGRTATLTNGPTLSNINGGVITFDGVDDYAIITSSVSLSEYTFSLFCRWIATAGVNDRIFGSDAFGTYTVFNPGNVGFHYNPLGSSGTTTAVYSGVNVGFGQWCQVTVSVSATGSSVIIYINGVSTNSTSTIPSGNLANNLFIGSQSTLYRSNCYVGNFNLYNRALSATEVLQNYNATKSRFGL